MNDKSDESTEKTTRGLLLNHMDNMKFATTLILGGFITLAHLAVNVM